MSEFDDIMREYMDYSDSDTIHFLVEANQKFAQNQVLNSLTDKLYQLIVAKADKIDYTSVSRSRGDITKIENYEKLMQCLDLIKQIVVAYNDDHKIVDNILTTVENLKKFSPYFKKGFVTQCSFAVMLYNSISMSVVDCVTLMIATCIEYIKDPQINQFKTALNVASYNNTEKDVMYQTLVQFNDTCSNGDLKAALDYALAGTKFKHEAAEYTAPESHPYLTDPNTEDSQDKEVIHDDSDKDDETMEDDTDDEIEEGFRDKANAVINAIPGAAFITGTAMKGIALITKVFIPMIRQLTYNKYYKNEVKSQNLYAQADLLEMNAYQLQYNATLDEEKRKELFDKQMKLVAKWRAKANRLSIDTQLAKVKAEKEQNAEAVKYAVDDIATQSPEDAISNSSLF